MTFSIRTSASGLAAGGRVVVAGSALGALLIGGTVLASAASAATPHATPYATTTTVAASDSDPVWDQPITAAATVVGDHAGTVQFQLKGYRVKNIGDPVAVDSSGQATSPSFTPTPGDYTLQAVFTPTDTNAYAASTGTQDLSVHGATSNLTLTVNPASLVADVTVNAPSQASPDAEEAVEFIVDGNELVYADIVDGQARVDYALPTDHEHDVTATYIGTAYINGSSAFYDRDNPTITATATSASTRSDYGWYHTPATVSFTCATAAAQSPISGGCPKPATVSAQGETVVSRTITAADGGSATAAVGIFLDSVKPTVSTRGVSNGGRYYGAAPTIHCIGKDATSGIASCTVTMKKLSSSATGATVKYTATATDKAGNTARVSGTYTQLAVTLGGASYAGGAYHVVIGHTYTLLVASRSTPHYAGAAPAPAPATAKSKTGPAFVRAGTAVDTTSWAYGVTVTTKFRTHKLWHLSVSFGSTLIAITIAVK